MAVLAPSPADRRAHTLERLAYWRDRLIEHDRGPGNRVLTRDEITVSIDLYLDRLNKLNEEPNVHPAGGTP